VARALANRPRLLLADQLTMTAGTVLAGYPARPGFDCHVLGLTCVSIVPF